MIQVVNEFFGIIGVDMMPPANLAEMIPWLMQVMVGVVLVIAVFKLIAAIAGFFFDWRRLR